MATSKRRAELLSELRELNNRDIDELGDYTEVEAFLDELKARQKRVDEILDELAGKGHFAPRWNFREGATIECQSDDRYFDIGPEWWEIVGKRRLKSVICVQYGMAEETIVLLTFNETTLDPKDDTYEVGIGECLRPYDQRYTGPSLEEATFHFLTAIREATWI